MAQNHNPSLQGWTPSPDGRGSIDILSTCGVTLILCSWTVLCLNVSPDCRTWRLGVQKFFMACMCFLGPEFTFQLALGQWASAHRSVDEFRRSGHHDWTLTHAFLADMGGFVLQPKLNSVQEWVRFPLNAKQVHYLVIKDYIPYSAVHLDKQTIADRNKVDGIVRTITVCQILWFVIGCVARAMQHLAVTILELTTLGFIVCTIGTYYFWFHKPTDIGEAIVLKPDATIQEILIEAGGCAEEPYRRTPLDFVGREKNSWVLYWSFWFNILRKLGIRFATKKRPINKIPDDEFHSLSTASLCILFMSQTSYAAVHLSGWNYTFPTHSEAVYWHIATLNTIISIVIYWIADIYCFSVLPLLRKKPSLLPTSEKETKSEGQSHPLVTSIVAKLQNAANVLRNNSAGRDPTLYVPLKALIPVTLSAATYCLARGYIIIESFISLRGLPPSAYESVSWSEFLPHF